MSQVATKRGPYAPTRKRREKIAQAVLDLVRSGGHESLTIAQVAERAEMSETTLLYHFPSRDHLLVAALELADRQARASSHIVNGEPVLSITLEELRDAARSTSLDDPVQRLMRALKSLGSEMSHPAHSYFRERTRQQIELFTRMVELRQQDGIAHPDLDARNTAIEIIALWDGLGSMAMALPELDVADFLIDAFRRLTGENIMEARAILQDRVFGL